MWWIVVGAGRGVRVNVLVLETNISHLYPSHSISVTNHIAAISYYVRAYPIMRWAYTTPMWTNILPTSIDQWLVSCSLAYL